MYGQWVGEVEGTNKGFVYLNIDVDRQDFGRLHFPDQSVQPTYCTVKLNVRNSELSGELSNFYVDPFYPKKKDIVIPKGGMLKCKLLTDNLIEGEWKTDVGTNGKIQLVNSSKTEPSFESAKAITWEQFKVEAMTQKKKNPSIIFRGQSNAEYSLSCSLHRENRWDLIRYYEMSSVLCKYISEVTGSKFNIKDGKEYTELLYLAQHYGFPTPLLDWTESPFIAAFFAFYKHKKAINSGNISIYAFDPLAWKQPFELPNDHGYFEFTSPIVQVLDFINLKSNARAIAQQSVVTFSNMHRMDSYVEFMSQRAPCLTKYVISAEERNNVMEELQYMGITAAAMFPGLDGTCKMLKEKLF